MNNVINRIVTETNKILKSVMAKDFFYNFNSNNIHDDKCYVCLENIRYNNLVTPDCCQHRFCKSCLNEWSQRVNTCPVDRKMYREIMHKDVEGNNKYAQQVENRTRHCEICRQYDSTRFTSRCEQCDNRLHRDCRGVGLVNDINRKWLCERCDVAEDVPVEQTNRDRATRYLRSRRYAFYTSDGHIIFATLEYPTMATYLQRARNRWPRVRHELFGVARAPVYSLQANRNIGREERNENRETTTANPRSRSPVRSNQQPRVAVHDDDVFRFYTGRELFDRLDRYERVSSPRDTVDTNSNGNTNAITPFVDTTGINNEDTDNADGTTGNNGDANYEDITGVNLENTNNNRDVIGIDEEDTNDNDYIPVNNDEDTSDDDDDEDDENRIVVTE